MVTDQELFESLNEVLTKVQAAKDLVDDGKEVLCSRKLQGALVNISDLIIVVAARFRPPKTDSVESIPQTEPKEQPVV